MTSAGHKGIVTKLEAHKKVSVMAEIGGFS